MLRARSPMAAPARLPVPFRRVSGVGALSLVLLLLSGCVPGASQTPTAAPSEPTVVESGGVAYVVDPTNMSDAAFHYGVFEVGPDHCVYVTVTDSEGTVTYVAGFPPWATVSTEGVTALDVTYRWGQPAWFGRMGDGRLPAAVGARCAQATELWTSWLTAEPPDRS